MIKNYCKAIVKYLMIANPWLRDMAVLTRFYHGAIREAGFQNQESWGVDDRRGNHGYIRYTGKSDDIVFSSVPRPVTPRSRKATSDLTLVLVFKADDPESVMWAITEQLAAVPFPGLTPAVIEVITADADRAVILTEEIGDDSENWKAIRIRFSISWIINFKECNNPSAFKTMDRCCMEKIDLGCADNCEAIEPGAEFTHGAGALTIEYIFEGSSRFLEIDHPGGNISIPTTGMNEGYVYTIKIYSDGQPLIFTKNGVTTQCLELKTTAVV